MIRDRQWRMEVEDPVWGKTIAILWADGVDDAVVKAVGPRLGEASSKKRRCARALVEIPSGDTGWDGPRRRWEVSYDHHICGRSYGFHHRAHVRARSREEALRKASRSQAARNTVFPDERAAVAFVAVVVLDPRPAWPSEIIHGTVAWIRRRLAWPPRRQDV